MQVGAGTRLRIGVERLVHNLATEHGLSTQRAIFLLETALQELKARPPTPTGPPAGELDARAA